MKESEMLNAWLWDKHRMDVQWRRVRLGIFPTKEMARMYMTMLRWADAIYIKEGVVNIVEAKLRPMPGAIGQLELYQKLFRNTLEFKQYWKYPIRLTLLTSMPDTSMIELTSEKGIIYEIYTLEDVNIARRQRMQPVL